VCWYFNEFGLILDGSFVTERDEQDRRILRIYITDQTKEVMPLFHQIFRGWLEVLFDGFTGDEREEAFELLNGMLGNTRHRFNREEK